jgi:diguanylate cyclase (GGDEF)-like protein
MRLAGELCGAHASSVRLIEPADDRLHLAAHVGLGERYVARGPVRLGESVCGAAALAREAIHVASAATDPRLASSGLAHAEGIVSLLCLPLVMRGRCIGVITFYHRAPREYADDEMQFLAAFAGTVSIAIDNARLYAEQARLAVTDGLTALFNHRHFQEALAGEIARARRYGHPVSLVMVDIDHFKCFNDGNGHQAGDALLRELAASLRRAARENDLVARYGGEEFVFLLPETSKSEAFALAGRVCSAVARRAWDGAGALPGGRLTVSLGVASFPEDAASQAELVQRADQALYLAKNEGRNQVQAWQAMN